MFVEKWMIRQNLRNRRGQNIVNLTLNPSKTRLFALTSGKILYYVDLEPIYSNRSTDGMIHGLIPVNFRSSEARHFGAITGLATNLWHADLIASCSSDQTLSVWNMVTNEFEMRLELDEELLGLSLHPSGMFIMAATADKLVKIAMYVDEPRLRVLDSLRADKCTICEFANSDDMFAFVSGTFVKIFSFMRLEQLGLIRTHEMGRIKELR